VEQFRTIARVSTFLFAFTFGLFAGGVSAQAPTGSLRGVTSDPSGAAVVGAEITVTDNATRAEYKTVSGPSGEFSVDNLNPGVYTVTVVMKGFRKSVFTDVKIIVSQIYDLAAKLELGALGDTVMVEAGQEVVETQSATVGASIVGRAITELPFTSRSTLDLATLMPGAATTGRARQTSFDGLPKGAINITYDGINAQDNLLKSNDGFFTVTRPSIDAVEEFSISTAANGAEESGQGAVQIKMETKRGGNAYHGGVWEYFRNDALNANYYFNNENGVPRQKQRLNQYGYKIGGPILKDRLFFFTDFDFYNSPQGRSFTRQILTQDAANGLFTYATTTPQTGNAWTTCVASSARNNNGPACTVNLAQLAAAKGFTYTPDPFITTAIGNVEAARSAVSTSTQFNPWLDNAVYNQSGTATRKFPDFRFDWQAAKNHQITAIYHYSKFVSSPDFLNNLNPFLPVAPFSKLFGSQISNRNQYTAAWRWNIGTTMSNELRFGLQTALVAFFPDEDASQYPVAQTNLGKIIVRPVLNSGLFPGSTATANFQPFLAFNTQGRNTPLGTILDNYSWTKGRHSMTFGGDATEIRFHQFLKGQRLVQTSNVGLSSVDPVNSANNFGNNGNVNFPGMGTGTNLAALQQLFGVLTGRVTSYSGTISVVPSKQQYVPAAPNLQQAKQHEFGIYAADSWRMRPTLTFNYGLRWEYQGSPYDQLNESFSLVNGFPGVFGVSGPNNLFKPGTLTGSISSLQLNNGRSWYNTDLHDFAPSIGLAWQPNISLPVLRNIFPGSGKTVFRAGYGITYTREGFNNFDSIAYGNPGIDGSIFANSVAQPVTGCSAAAAPGNLNAGCITLNGLVNGSGLTSLATNPATFPATGTFQVVGFSGQSVNAFDPNLRTPRVQSWSVGIQRQLNQDTVLEVRYVGNHGTGLWRQDNINEVNIFENGFLNEFNLAKANLAANIAGGCGTRFDPVAGCSTNALPIMTAAFKGVSVGSGFGSGSLITFLNNNAAGSFANSLATTSTFMCNLAGQNAFPGASCPASSPAVGPYPANLFEANPNAGGTSSLNGAFRFFNGSQSTYNALQVEVRRRFSKGFQVAANYAFSKSLTNYYGDSSVNFVPFSTLRNPGHDKGPSPWDLRHVFKADGIYELPFGPGHHWSTPNGFANRVIGGWQISSIHRLQSGRNFLLTSGNLFNNTSDRGTFNQYDPGVVLNGITPNQLESMLGVRKTPGKVFWFPASLIGANGAANPAFIAPCTTAGQLCQRIFLTGPHFYRADISLTKKTTITERVNFEIRAEALDAFNNINFYFPNDAATSFNFVNVTGTSFGRITNAFQDPNTTDDNGGRILQLVFRINF
jgi:hypothetical protein